MDGAILRVKTSAADRLSTGVREKERQTVLADDRNTTKTEVQKAYLFERD